MHKVTLRVIIAVVQVWALKIYVAEQWRRSSGTKRKNRMKLNLPPPPPPKLLEKLV
jgi:hypothetical protein